MGCVENGVMECHKGLARGWLLFEGCDSRCRLQKPGEMQEAGQWRQAAGLVA